MKRYMCKTCERTFNALTGTPLAHLHKRELWLDYARALVEGVSLRKAAWRVGVHLETSFRWRHRFLAAARNNKACALTGIVEADETFILKSAKGFHIQNVNGYMSRFKGWLRPFNGVASKYLPSYLSWRRTIEREGERFTPERCLQVAFGCRST